MIHTILFCLLAFLAGSIFTIMVMALLMSGHAKSSAICLNEVWLVKDINGIHAFEKLPVKRNDVWSRDGFSTTIKDSWLPRGFKPEFFENEPVKADIVIRLTVTDEE